MRATKPPAHQGRGYSTLLMREFVARMRRAGNAAIHLMCKSRHVDLYAKQGYRYVKRSDSTHGGMTWHEMLMELRRS